MIHYDKNIGFKTFTISSQPFYDQFNQCYKNIMVINVFPQGPLKYFVRRTQFPRLSTFQRTGPCNPIPLCGFAIQSLKGLEIGFGLNRFINNGCCINNLGCNLMTPDEIPNLITFLTGNGYQIETQITNMLNQSEIKLSNQKIVFTVTYYGNNQPNLTYIR